MSSRNYRKRCVDDEEEEDNAGTFERVNDIRKLQKIRKMNTLNYQVVRKTNKESEYGLHDMKSILNRDEKSFGDVFAQETNNLDTDLEMKNFIEMELARRTGISPAMENANEKKSQFDLVDDVLQAIPDRLKPKVPKAKEDMVSNQMLCGIPEVDLGVEAKMKNIIATEEAKQRLMKERWSAKQNEAAVDSQVILVPKNISVNFAEQSKVVQEVAKEKPHCPGTPSTAQLKEECEILKTEKSTDFKKWENVKNQLKKKK